jgi:hypothetical protein
MLAIALTVIAWATGAAAQECVWRGCRHHLMLSVCDAVGVDRSDSLARAARCCTRLTAHIEQSGGGIERWGGVQRRPGWFAASTSHDDRGCDDVAGQPHGASSRRHGAQAERSSDRLVG